MSTFATYLTLRRFLIVALTLLPTVLVFETVHIWSSPDTRWQFPFGHDFVAFWAAAQLLADGGASALYDIPSFAALQDEVSVRPGLLLWHYPPTYAALILPLAGFSFAFGFLLFTAVNLGALWAAMRRMLPAKGLVGWAALFGAPIIAVAVVQGQNGAFFTACLVGGVLALRDERRWLAAILFAMILAKPQYGPLIPLILIAMREWRVMWQTALCCGVFIALSAAIFGPSIWVYFSQNTGMLAFTLTEPELLAQMPTVWATLTLGGATPAAALIGHLVFAVLSAVVVWVMWRRYGLHSDLALAALLFGTLMISPYSFRYDMVLTLVGALLLAKVLQQQERLHHGKIGLLALWIGPALMPAVALITTFQVGPLLSLGGLYLVLREARLNARSGAVSTPLFLSRQYAVA